MEEGLNVVYYFADGTKQVCSINSKVLTNEKGRRRTIGEIESIFATTAHDLGAISYQS
jgi:hypothetical protein